jgi:hypothetical protein
MRALFVTLALALTLAAGFFETRAAQESDGKREFTSRFDVVESDLAATGRNPYFILEPGYQLAFEGKEKGKKVALVITVLKETKKVGNVETRVVEERETMED